MYNGDYFVMYALNFKPIKGFKCGSNVGIFRGVGDSTGKCILNLLKVFNLRERESMVKRVTVIETRVNKGSADSSSGGKVKCMTDTIIIIITMTIYSAP